MLQMYNLSNIIYLCGGQNGHPVLFLRRKRKMGKDVSYHDLRLFTSFYQLSVAKLQFVY